MKSGRSVVITGMGLVTPLGCEVNEVWEKLLRGESAAEFLPGETIDGAGARYYCPVTGVFHEEGLRRHVSFALKAADMAMSDAKLDTARHAPKTGVSVGSSKGAISSLLEFHRPGADRRGDFENSGAFDAFYSDGAAARIAGKYGLRGPVTSPMAACSTGAHAILAGSRMIKAARADVMIAGSTESCFTPLLLAGYAKMGVLATGPGAPSSACRPYDSSRDGFILGEGCGIMILEEREHAERRGAGILAELKGGAAGSDVAHITAPEPSGHALAGVISRALIDANTPADAIGYINTHGTATRLNDPAETRAIKSVFGEKARRLSLSSTKAATGHLLGAAGSVEFIIAILSLRRGAIPPTINLQNPDPECDLDYTPLRPGKKICDNVMSISMGFGGHIGVLVAGKPGQP